MRSNIYMYVPIRKQINIMSIKGGLYFVVVLMGLTETKLGLNMLILSFQI